MLTLLAAQALAAPLPDLTTSITAPSGVYVYQSATWQVTARNIGNKDAVGTTLTIQLPTTNTSPQVYVMGTLGSKSASCSQSGTRLICSLGTLRRGSNTTVSFNIALPESAGTLDFSATASTTTGESNTANNGSTAVASLLNYSPTFTGDATVTNRHCTGTNLESFFECELFPSSISSHDAILHSDGSVSIPADAGYSGSWSITGDQLWFEYTDTSGQVLEFTGYGVDASCWEGITTFTNSPTYVSPYEVCL